jgi:hypothetical protein
VKSRRDVGVGLGIMGLRRWNECQSRLGPQKRITLNVERSMLFDQAVI